MELDEDEYLSEQDTDRCEHRGCDARAVAYDEDGRFLCLDCLEERVIGQHDGEDE